MTLTTHAMVGAAAASLFPSNPVLAFTAGFCSHFCIDALPHWDYKLLSKQEPMEIKDKLEENMNVHSKEFIFDLFRVGGDAVLGTILAVFIFSLWLFHLPLWLVVLGAWAGILPDPLQFVYFRLKPAFMTPLQRFHIWVQKGKSIHPPAWLGLSYQALLVVVIIAIVKFI